jgi:hypothetical protein
MSNVVRFPFRRQEPDGTAALVALIEETTALWRADRIARGVRKEAEVHTFRWPDPLLSGDGKPEPKPEPRPFPWLMPPRPKEAPKP